MGEDRPALALFDLDDTLCDYARARSSRLRIAFSRAGVTGSETLNRLVAESISRQPHGSAHFAELLAAHGVRDPAAVDAATGWFRANRFHGLELFPEAEPILRALRGDGHPVGIITNGPADVQRAKVILLGVDRLVDFVLISGEFGAEKPDPAIFAAALEQGARPAAEAVFVGDALEFDIAGANRSGIRSVWINRRGRALGAADPAPAHEVASLAEADRIIRTAAAR